jgi:hypothetical protein
MRQHVKRMIRQAHHDKYCLDTKLRQAQFWRILLFFVKALIFKFLNF